MKTTTVKEAREFSTAVGTAYAKSSTQSVQRAVSGQYQNIRTPNTSVRDSFNRFDYDWFRPGEAMPTRDQDIIDACMQAYERFPLVHSTLDLMADFCIKGIRPLHQNARCQKVAEEWAKRIGMEDRSERIASMLFRSANSIVVRETAKLPAATMDMLKTAKAKVDAQRPRPANPLADGEIPLGYTVMDPRVLEVINAELSSVMGRRQPQYAIRLPAKMASLIDQAVTGPNRDIANQIPKDVRDAAKKGAGRVPLDPKKVVALHYKKDDGRAWGTPLLYPLLDDLSMYQKHRLADRAALDGAISNVRLWNLGNLEFKIPPTAAAIQKLADILSANTGGGSFDIIWGPELTFKESSTEVYKFLGKAKYEEVLESIHQGLGIPVSMAAKADGGFTNNMVSLKVLLERLEYARRLIAQFWLAELDILRDAFGFRLPFELAFDTPSLSDDSGVLKLLVDLADRDIISNEFIVERFGGMPEIEAMRIRREQKLREKGKAPVKAGPYHDDSRQKNANERSFVQQGHLTPSQTGLDVPPAKKGEQTPAQFKAEQDAKNAALKVAKPTTGKPKKPAGRPKNAGDVGPRKKKIVRPRAKAMLQTLAWATRTQATIAELTQPVYLEALGKRNLRQLTDQETRDYEAFKFAALASLEFGQEVDVASLMKQVPEVPADVAELVADSLADIPNPTVEQTRQAQAHAVALYLSEPETAEHGED